MVLQARMTLPARRAKVPFWQGSVQGARLRRALDTTHDRLSRVTPSQE
jgi:hypothetical protein